jgi:capsular polysaccharide biosynthesis protein
VLGVVVAGMVVLALVFLDESIRSPADVQRYVGLPLLGSIPRHRALPAAGVPLRHYAMEGSQPRL